MNVRKWQSIACLAAVWLSSCAQAYAQRAAGVGDAAKRKPTAPARAGNPASAGFDESPLGVVPVRAFADLEIKRPVLLTHAGDKSGRVFIGSQLGQILVLANQEAKTSSKVFLDLSQKTFYEDKEFETGLLGLAFHPQYAQNGQFFVYYTAQKNPYTNVVARYRVKSNDAGQADPASEEILLRIEKPFWNHNGGTLVFGPDKYLYIATGDGGGANDPQHNGQNLDSLLGKILRIDVDHGAKPGRTAKADALPYAIPRDNPFVGKRAFGARPEIWAYGLRNPWRIAFDSGSGKLWAADVGQDEWEEIDIITRGGNYGWSVREGRHPFGENGAPATRELIEPIWEYPHSVGKSITGGQVYRGNKVPELIGGYLYADFVTGKLWALWYEPATNRVTANRPILGNQMPVMSFGADEDGEVYFTLDTGKIYRFESK